MQADGMPPSAEMEGKYVGSGIIARMFYKSDTFRFTTRSGPREHEVKRRVVRNCATGRIIHDCVPGDTSDADLRLRLQVANHYQSGVAPGRSRAHVH